MKPELPKNEQAEVALVVKNAEQLVVKTYEQVMDASDILRDVKEIGEKITARKEEITKPMNDALKSVRSFFRPYETRCEEAEAAIKGKILDWHASHWAEQNVPDNTIFGTRGKVTVTEGWSVEIEDAAKIPRELCSPDTDRIKKALEAGLKIKGARLIPTYRIASGKL